MLRVSIQGQESCSLSLLLDEWVQVWVCILQLTNYVLDLFKLDICEPWQTTVWEHKPDLAISVNLRCFHSHLLRFYISLRSTRRLITLKTFQVTAVKHMTFESERFKSLSTAFASDLTNLLINSLELAQDMIRILKLKFFGPQLFILTEDSSLILSWETCISRYLHLPLRHSSSSTCFRRRVLRLQIEIWLARRAKVWIALACWCIDTSSHISLRLNNLLYFVFLLLQLFFCAG